MPKRLAPRSLIPEQEDINNQIINQSNFCDIRKFKTLISTTGCVQYHLISLSNTLFQGNSHSTDASQSPGENSRCKVTDFAVRGKAKKDVIL